MPDEPIMDTELELAVAVPELVATVRIAVLVKATVEQ